MSLDVTLKALRITEVFECNITHNLGEMADAAGIYKHLWRPEEIGISKAADLIRPLNAGLHKLKDDPEKYKCYNPRNGWGEYDSLVKFVEKYIAACIKNPDATISISR